MTSYLEAIAGVLATVRDVAQPDPGADFSVLFAAAARESRLTPFERFANEHFTLPRDRRPQLIQRVAIAGAALLVFVAMSSGLAYAADGAKPGDLLYGLDRALEAVGVGSGGATERLTEVEDLVAAGAISDGLHHASEVLDGNPASDEAKAALAAAAARLENAAEGPGAPVDDLIDYLRAALASGEGVNAQTVADLAQRLVHPPADPGSQADPAGPPADPGSPADPAGPPADPGSQSSGRALPEHGAGGK